MSGGYNPVQVLLQSHSLEPALLGPGQHSFGPCAFSQGMPGLAHKVLIGESRTEWALAYNRFP